MPELLTKHPEVTIYVLRSAGAKCGEGSVQEILTKCHADSFCKLPGGEICVYGLADASKMTQISTSELQALGPRRKRLHHHHRPPPACSSTSPSSALFSWVRHWVQPRSSGAARRSPGPALSCVPAASTSKVPHEASTDGRRLSRWRTA